MSKFYYTGTDVEVPQEDLARAVNAGEVEADPTGPVIIKDQAGNRTELAPENVQNIGEWLNRGYRVEGPAENESVQARLEARNSPLLTAGEALASGATLGLSDVAASAIGGDEYKRNANMRREELGQNAVTALQIVGGAIPALATGGSGLLAKGLSYTPAGLLASGAQSVGQAATRAALSRGASAAAAKIIGMAAEGGLDGLVSNVGMATSEASLGNADLNAEYLLSQGALGALIGGGLGGLFGVAAARSSASRRAADRIRSEVTGEAVDDAARAAGGHKLVPDSLTDRIVNHVVDIGAPVTGMDRDLLKEAFTNPNLRSDIINSQAVEDGIGKAIREKAQSFLDTSHYLRQMYNGEIKTANLARDVIQNESMGNEAINALEDAFVPYYRELDNLHQSGLISKAQFARYEKGVDLTMRRAAKNMGSLRDEVGEAWRGFDAVEDMKRAADSMRKQMSGKVQGDALSRESIPRLHKAAADLGDNLRNLLEREDLWGPAAAKQREMNAALHSALDVSKNFNKLTEGTGESLSREYWDVEKRILDGGKVNSFVKNMTNANEEFANNQIKEHVKRVANLYDTALRNGTVPDELVPAFQKSRLNAVELGQILDSAEARLGKIGQFKLAEQAQKDFSTVGGNLGGTGAILGGFAGGGIGAGVGALAGRALGAVTQPVSLVKTIARLETVAQRVRKGRASVASGTKRAIEQLTGDARVPSSGRVRASSRAAATRALTFGDDRKDRMRDVERRLQELQNDPSDLVSALGYQQEELAQAAPMTALAVSQKVYRALDFLRSKLPKQPSEINMLRPGSTGRLWDDVTIDSFDKIMQTIEDPQTATRDLALGRLTPDSVEALKAVHPYVYDDMRSAAIDYVSNRKDDLPFNSVIQLSLLLGFNGDESMTPSYQKIIQGLDEKKEGQQPKPPSKSQSATVTVQKSVAARAGDGLERR